MDRLMEKLMISKAIMDKSDSIKKTGNGGLPPTSLQQFDAPEAKFNIPQEFMSEMKSPSGLPADRPMKVPTIEAIKNSKLPDEIKKIMIEHPIQPAQMQTSALSNELVEKATRLMRGDSKEPVKEQQTTQKTSNIDVKQIQQIVESTVRKVLKENGLISESEEKTNEVFSFKVGKHIFEGKVTKIKKIS
jgi:hypothetical protein